MTNVSNVSSLKLGKFRLCYSTISSHKGLLSFCESAYKISSSSLKGYKKEYFQITFFAFNHLERKVGPLFLVLYQPNLEVNIVCIRKVTVEKWPQPNFCMIFRLPSKTSPIWTGWQPLGRYSETLSQSELSSYRTVSYFYCTDCSLLDIRLILYKSNLSNLII